MTKKVNQNYFCKWHLEKWSLKHGICKFQFFSRFWVKCPGFYHFLSKIPCFPGRVGTLYKATIYILYLAWCWMSNHFGNHVNQVGSAAETPRMRKLLVFVVVWLASSWRPNYTPVPYLEACQGQPHIIHAN